MTRRMAGAVALTVAAVLLMSAAWFYFLSPTSERSDDWRYDFTIEGLASEDAPFSAEEGQTIHVTTSLYLVLEEEQIPPLEMPPYNVQVFDPRGELVMRQENLFGYHVLKFEAPKTGDYVIEIENLSNRTAAADITIRGIVQFRPAAPIGTWFLMMSLPVLVFGILAIIKRE